MEKRRLNNWEELKEQIIKKIPSNSKKILIQAGHFSLIFNKDGILIPAVFQDIKDPRLIDFIRNSNYMNNFPLETFNIGMDLAIFFKSLNKDVKFAFIVNDWQWVNKGLYNFKTNRRSFYKKQMFPISYHYLFSKYEFNYSNIIRSNHYINHNIYFSEQKLKKIGKKDIKDCSPESCAIEYLPFLSEITNNIDVIISFIPMSCKVPVLYSAVRFIKAQSHNIDLFHIFYNPINNEIDFSYLSKVNIEETEERIIFDNYKKMELMSK